MYLIFNYRKKFISESALNQPFDCLSTLGNHASIDGFVLFPLGEGFWLCLLDLVTGDK